MMTELADLTKRTVIRAVENWIARTTGRHYLIRFDLLDQRSLDEFVKLMRDLDSDRQNAVRQAREQPWRR
jgi:hypothetical protein